MKRIFIKLDIEREIKHFKMLQGIDFFLLKCKNILSRITLKS